jgi:hypothetical protein
MCHRSLITNAPTWVDGPVLDILESFRSGRIYQADGLRTMPYTVLTHTPLSYIAGYLPYRIWPGFISLRLTNILATLGCSTLIFIWVRGRTASLVSAFFAACVFLLLPPVFQWSQTARSPDAFSCLFSIAALLALDYARGRYRDLLIALLFAAAFLSKQTALFVLFPSLVVVEYRRDKSFFTTARWPLLAGVLLGAIFVTLLVTTHGGFWTNIVDGNLGCAKSLDQFVLVTLRHLCFFWLFVAAAWWLSSSHYSSAHVWAILAIGFGLATCAKAGSDTMYFFDASAAAAMLAGIGLHTATAKRATVLVCSLLLCVKVFDLNIARTTAPVVAEGYRTMLTDLARYPTIFSDEASISIRTGRPWYWGDPLVLNALATQGKWDDTEIARGIAARRYSAIVIWNPTAWPKRDLELVQKNYIFRRAYPAFRNEYRVYLPLSSLQK